MIIKAITLPGGTLNTISGDIVIETGVHEINDPLYMLPGAKITVKKGARLKIYDKITAACGGMWEGIMVEGSPGASQSISNSTNASQGWVGLYGDGEIEHARIGIRLETADGGFGGGGILFPCMGTFTNCTTSIKFGAHFTPVSNRAFIQTADFLLDGEYRGESEPQPIFIDLLYNTMVSIKGCTFNDDRSIDCSDPGFKAIGIDAKASSVNTWGNDFENLAIGIRVNQQLIGATLANTSTYTNCYQGIETIKSSKFSIYNNDFLLGNPDDCESVGVTLSGNTAGLTFRQNSFSQNGSGTTIGTKVQSTMLGIKNVIFDNDYTNLDIGNIAFGFNGNEDGGISYVCNTHAGGENDYIVDANATVWEQQKYISPTTGQQTATGNLFSGGSGKGSFNNANGSNIQYFFAGFGSALNQEHFSYNSATYSGVLGEDETSNGDCTSSPPCMPCPPESPSTAQHKADFYEKRQERNNKLDTLATLTHPVKIALMQDSIRNLKQVMDHYASLVLQSYSQDTTEAATIQIDTIFAWLDRSDTYAGDLERVNLYFFMGKLGKFDTLLSLVPTIHSLAGDSLGEFEELELIYDLLRPTIEEEESLSQLAQPILDSLAFWQDWCSEPGFLVKSVLLWNGIETVQDCDNPQKTTERHNSFGNKTTKDQLDIGMTVYPNPANNSVTVSFGGNPQDKFRITIYNMHGHRCHEEYHVMPINELVLPLAKLSSGLYFLKIHIEGKRPMQAKFSILH